MTRIHSSAAWQRALVLMLAVAVGLQGIPLASLVSTVAPTPCVCEQRGFCPRNPDGDCACDHHGDEHSGGDTRGPTTAESDAHPAPAAGDQPVLRSCDTGGPDAMTAGAAKWIVPRSGFDLRPPRPTSLLGRAFHGLVSQHIGSDPGFPPWPRPA